MGRQKTIRISSGIVLAGTDTVNGMIGKRNENLQFLSQRIKSSSFIQDRLIVTQIRNTRMSTGTVIAGTTLEAQLSADTGSTVSLMIKDVYRDHDQVRENFKGH